MKPPEIHVEIINTPSEVNDMENDEQIEEKEKMEEKFDSTAMFHCVEEQDLSKCLLDGTKKQNFKNHVIVCVYSGSKSSLIGLRSFILPLRASNYEFNELKTIVLIGDVDFLAKEWKQISTFPKLFLIPVFQHIF